MVPMSFVKKGVLHIIRLQGGCAQHFKEDTSTETKEIIGKFCRLYPIDEMASLEQHQRQPAKDCESFGNGLFTIRPPKR